jgi:predicted O-methyltransferase YrrM
MSEESLSDIPFAESEIQRLKNRGWILQYARKQGVGAELGVFRGHFSEIIAEALQPKKLYLVDPWMKIGRSFGWGEKSAYTNFGQLTTEQAYEDAKARMASFKNINSIFVTDFAKDFLETLTEQLDWVYLDTTHRYEDTLRELNAIDRVLKADGVILGDDWWPSSSGVHYGVFKAVHDFIKNNDYQVIAAGPGGQYCLRRTPHIQEVGSREIFMSNNPLEKNLPFASRGLTYGEQWIESAHDKSGSLGTGALVQPRNNPLRDYFDAHQEGRGIWKWLHYFDIYHRHLSKFVGREVHVLEIGVYSGGSLHMWEHYFGPQCHLYGVDIAKGCKQYENEKIRIFIGDQADRELWKTFKKEVPLIDVVIDDGGHQPEQQIATLEEILPHIRPGGVYICEDIHGTYNAFTSYINGLAMNLNGMVSGTWQSSKIGHDVKRIPFQRQIDSLHLYPFVAVIEKANAPIDYLASRKHGTQWKPYNE